MSFNWSTAIAWAIARLGEGSSMAGLGLMLGSFHLCTQCDGLAQATMPVIIGLLGLAAFLIKDKGTHV